MSSVSELSVYIHVPFCRRRCAYCSFVSYAGCEAEIPAYVIALAKEITMRPVKDSEINTIYFGGGTPSLVPVNSLNEIFKALKESYVIADDVEATLEANPGTIDREYLRTIRSLGVNRLSLGVQTLDDAELKLLGRIHTADEAKAAIRQGQEAGFSNLSLDFIYGLPGRTLDQWQDMLDEIVILGVQHLSLYGLTLEEGTPLHARVENGQIAAQDDDSQAVEYEMAEKTLADAGYFHYEISNWSRPGYESRHNTAYWKRTSYLGLGVAAHSFLGDKRIANTPDLGVYLSAMQAGILPPQSVEVIDETAALSEALFLGLRLNEGVAADDIQARFSIDLYSRFGSEIAELVSLGLLDRETDRIRLTPRGRLLGNEVFMRFIA